MKVWYVEVKREDVRFGYVNADTRDEAIKKMTQAGAGDDDGVSTTVGLWEVVEAHEYESLGHHEDGAIKIL